MNRIRTSKLVRGSAALAAIAAVAVPAASYAAPGEIGNGLSFEDERYLEVRQKYVEANGVQAAGRDIVRDGFLERDGEVRAPTDAELQRSIEVMSPEPAPAPVATESDATAVASSGGSMNATVICESGGDYSADTGNGYYGGYQFDSGTWDAYGDPAYPEASDAPPEVQDAAAAAVPYDAWPNC